MSTHLSHLEAAKDLFDAIDSNAEKAVGDPLPIATVDAMVEADLHATMIPKVLGGPELGLLDSMDVWAEVARADGSAGWCLMASAATTAYFAAYCPDTLTDEMFGDGVPLAAGQFAPMGVGELSDDGVTVSGSYQFGSGINHAKWAGAGVITAPTDGSDAEYLFCITPRENAQVVGNWDVLGLQGTASYDYTLDSVLIPRHATFPLGAPRLRGGPMYDLGVIPLTSAGHAAFALGVVRRALDETMKIASTKQRMAGKSKIGEDQRFLYDLGVLESRFRAAELWVKTTYAELEADIIATDTYDARLGAAAMQANIFVTQEGADIVRQCYLHSGTAGLRQGPLNRCFRDIHAGTQHALTSPGGTIGFAEGLLTQPHISDVAVDEA